MNLNKVRSKIQVWSFVLRLYKGKVTRKKYQYNQSLFIGENRDEFIIFYVFITNRIVKCSAFKKLK